MEKVSVIVPIYNIEKYLPTCLESITAQTYNNIEIICVDDGSTDNSADVVRSFKQNDERIVFIQQKNGGLSAARNSGIDRATGDYIIFVDGDDWIDANTVEVAVKNKSDLTMWGYVSEFSDKKVVKNIFDGDKIFNETECKSFVQRRMLGLVGEELSAPQNFDALVTAWGKLYRTDIIKQNNLRFIDTKIIGTEDALFNLYYTEFCKKCVYINQPFNHYRKDNISSLTRTYKADLFAQWQNLYSKMSEYIIKKNCPEQFKIALNNRICWSIVGLGLTELLNKKGTKEKLKNIRKILHNERYIQAYNTLEMKYFPLHWKLFFFCCEKKLSAAVYTLIKFMCFLIEN